MTRARRVLAATLVGALCSAGAAFAQDGNQAPFTPILSGKSFTPPIRGVAEVEYTKPSPKREKDSVIIKIDVKNVSNAPIARLVIDETWYNKAGATISGGKGQIKGLLQPGEVKTITIEMPFNAALTGDKMQFSHANGSVNQHLVAKVSAGDSAKEPEGKKK